MPKRITESLGAATATKPGRVKFTIITPGQGSSGNYTAEMLQQAQADNVFPKGTLSMVNHPSASERYERPEGDLRNLAGVLLEDAYWDGQGLVAEAKISSAWRDFVDEFHEHIGVSIYAQAEVNEAGELVRLLPDPFNRVDLVTVPGRGGEISEVLEAARVVESRSVVQETTQHDIELWLSAAVRDAVGRWVWVLDHDSEYVYYEADDEQGRERTYRRAYALNGSQVEFTAPPEQVHRRTEYDPVITGANIAVTDPISTDTMEVLNHAQPSPAAATTTQEGAIMATIDEQELQQLQERARRADELEQENQQLREQQAQQALEARQQQARAAVEAAFGENAPEFYVHAAETAAAAEDYDHDAFTAQLQEAAGHSAVIAGTPNLGTATGTATETFSEHKITSENIVNALEGRE